MSVRAVDVAIHRARALIDEMEGVDSENWLPDHTLLVFVDPMLRALGWDPSQSEECRPCCSVACVAGYSLSADPVAGGTEAQDLVVLAAPLGTSLAEAANCVWSDREARFRGVVALTDGRHWRFYDAGRLAVDVDVLSMRRGTAAGILTEWLGKSAFVGTF